MPSCRASSAVDLLAREQEVAAPVGAQQQGPHDLHRVARHQAAGEMGGVLEVGVLGRQHHVAQHGQLGVDRHRPVDGGDHRHLDGQHLVDQPVALPDDPVPHGGVGPALGQRVGAVAQSDERVAGAGDDHHPVLPVRGDGVEQLGELLVGRSAPHQRLPPPVHPDRQHPGVVAAHVGRRPPVFVLVQLHAAQPSTPRRRAHVERAGSRLSPATQWARGSPVMGGGMVVPRGRKIVWWRMRASSGAPGPAPAPTTSPSITWYQWSLRS